MFHRHEGLSTVMRRAFAVLIAADDRLRANRSIQQPEPALLPVHHGTAWVRRATAQSWPSPRANWCNFIEIVCSLPGSESVGHATLAR